VRGKREEIPVKVPDVFPPPAPRNSSRDNVKGREVEMGKG